MTTATKTKNALEDFTTWAASLCKGATDAEAAAVARNLALADWPRHPDAVSIEGEALGCARKDVTGIYYATDRGLAARTAGALALGLPHPFGVSYYTSEASFYFDVDGKPLRGF